MKIYIDGQLMYNIIVKTGTLMYDPKNSPYITLHRGKVVVAQKNIRLTLNNTEYYMPGLAVIESDLICINTTL